MKNIPIAMVLVLVALTAAGSSPTKELEGSWTVVKATLNNKESHDPALLQAHWRFQGNELVLQSRQKGTVQFQIEVAVKSEPKAFHLTSVGTEKAGSGWMLFLREGNTLKIAFYDNLEGRPESFEPREPRHEPELVVVTLAPKK